MWSGGCCSHQLVGATRLLPALASFCSHFRACEQSLIVLTCITLSVQHCLCVPLQVRYKQQEDFKAGIKKKAEVTSEVSGPDRGCCGAVISNAAAKLKVSYGSSSYLPTWQLTKYWECFGLCLAGAQVALCGLALEYVKTLHMHNGCGMLREMAAPTLTCTPPQALQKPAPYNINHTLRGANALASAATSYIARCYPRSFSLLHHLVIAYGSLPTALMTATDPLWNLTAFRLTCV